MTKQSQEQQEILRRLRRYRNDPEAHARDCLKIKDKVGGIVPLVYNTAQRFLHDKIEEQRKDKGKVRALVLKGRQGGASTYVGARYYSRASLCSGVNVFILAHEQGSSDNLFEMVERFHRHNPLKPHTGASNAKELEFDALDSRYTVAIAGIKASGRSRTTTLFHGSEVAWWENPQGHFAASVQTVPDLQGTEIILETTANGATGLFYDLWQEAEDDENEYLPVFIPWYWIDEYRMTPPPGFQLSREPEGDNPSEAEYAELFGLDMEQMAWRRNKIRTGLRSIELFNQEYPATAEMAFVSHNPDALISSLAVMKARKNRVEAAGPLVIGIDPAGPGADKFCICARRGNKVEWIEARRKIGTNEAVAWIRDVIDTHKPERVFVDAGGLGSAIISAARDIGPEYSRLIRGVDFGAPSEHKMARPKTPGPKNRRAEMWDRLREWLESEEEVDIPHDDDALHRDLTTVRAKPTISNDMLLESKAEIKRRGGRSPDRGDALALTFASLFVSRGAKEGDGADPSVQTGRVAHRPHMGGSWMGV